MKRSKEMFFNLVLMTVATLVMRFVAMAFNVYISGKIGAAGMGLYSLTMSVGTFGITLALSGINFASTRLCAAAIGHESNDEVGSVMQKCIVYALVFGLVSALGLFFLSEPISVKLLYDDRCTVLLKVFAVSLPFISLTSALAGYFSAVRRVIKSAFAAFFEQGVKIGLCVLLISMIAPKGTKYACLAVILGTSLSQIASFMLSLIQYLHDKSHHHFGNNKPIKNITSKLLAITVPISLGTYVRSGLVTVEHLIIPWGLRKFGASSVNALALYGTLQEMAIPIILFPQALVGSMAGLLVPELSERQARCEFDRIESIIARCMKFTLCFSFGVSGIMMMTANQLGICIYQSSVSGYFIACLAPLIPIMYLDHTVDGMLKGLGEQLYSMKVNVLDAFLSVICVFLLVPSFGIMGYVITIYVMEIINASFSILRLFKICNIKFKIFEWVVKPLFSVIASYFVLSLKNRLMPILNVSDNLRLAIDIIFAVFVYSALLRITKAIIGDDIKYLKSAIR